jgi:hypothetical protein
MLCALLCHSQHSWHALRFPGDSWAMVMVMVMVMVTVMVVVMVYWGKGPT